MVNLKATELGDLWAGQTAQIGFTIEDQAGAPMQPATLTVTIYDVDSDTAIQSNVDIIASCTAGVVAFDLVATDTALQSSKTRKAAEKRRVIFKWTFASTKVGMKIGLIDIKPETHNA